MKKIMIIDRGPRKQSWGQARWALPQVPVPVTADENWEKDLQRAFDAGKRMAENILVCTV